MDKVIELIEGHLRNTKNEVENHKIAITKIKSEIVEISKNTQGYGDNYILNCLKNVMERYRNNIESYNSAHQTKEVLITILEQIKEEQIKVEDALPITFLKNVKTDLLMRELYQREETIVYNVKAGDTLFQVKYK